MLDIRKANRWKFPKFSYTNMRAEFPNMGDTCFTSWLSLNRYWSGRIWKIAIKHHVITVDFRLCWVSDIVFPDASSKDCEAVNEAIKEINK